MSLPNDQLKEAFLAGVRAGMSEQCERDYPDVGMRFDKTPEQLWGEYLAPPPRRRRGGGSHPEPLRFRSVNARPLPPNQ